MGHALPAFPAYKIFNQAIAAGTDIFPNPIEPVREMSYYSVACATADSVLLTLEITDGITSRSIIKALTFPTGLIFLQFYGVSGLQYNFQVDNPTTILFFNINELVDRIR